MPKNKKSTGQRAQLKTLPKRNRKLGGKDLKKVKGGVIMANTEGDFHVKASKIKITPEF
jgi:hypothetical protein